MTDMRRGADGRLARRALRRLGKRGIAVPAIFGVMAIATLLTAQAAVHPPGAGQQPIRVSGQPRAVKALPSKPPAPRKLSAPRELRLTKAQSKVFDVRKLKSTVVKKERPEREAPGFTAMGGGELDALGAAAPSATAPSALPSAIPKSAMAAANAPAPSPSASFDGLDFANWGAGHPPDENGDVGPNYYIQTVNTAIGIYDKSNGNRVAAFTFDAFMSQGNFGNLCDTDNFGDPVVLYDTFEGRWFITDFAFKLDGSGNVMNPPGAFQCFAVSKTGDPVAGGWNFYSIAAPGALNDYPKFGVWPDGIYMSANMFGYPAGGSYTGYHVWALNKQQMYAGAPSPQVVDFAGDTSDFTVIPANARLQAGTPPAGSSEYLVSTEQFLNALSIYKFHVDWDKISTSTFTGPQTQAAPTCWPNSAVANASTPANAADTLSIRAMAQAQYSNIGGVESLWVDHTVNRGEFAIANCGGTNTNNATIRWYQANVSGGNVAANVVQDQSLDPEGANTFFRFMPSLAVDRLGDMAVGYTKSNATTHPQIKYAGRLAGDPANTLGQSEQTLIDGTGSQSGNCGSSACVRWGDYSGMALDPNGCDFWMTGEYYATTGLNDLTRIGSFKLNPNCTPVGNGTLHGTVTDGTTAIAGATVTLGSRTATTAADGAYSFTVPAGTYPTLSASKPGFDSASTATIAVPDAGTATRNFTLGAAVQSGCFTDNTQSAFQRGVPSNCDLNASPGNVVLANPDNTDAKNTIVSPTGFAFNNTSWAGQTFTPTVSGQLNRVDVELFCSGCSGANPNITLSIRNTAGSPAVPTGADLGTATLPGFNDGGAGGLKTITFSTPVAVTAGTRYAFIFRATAPRTGTYAYTCSCATTGFSNSNPYANGQFVTSTNSGSTWSADTTVGGRDLNFVTYINPGFASSGTYVSSLKDANPAPGRNPTWTTLSFTATQPAGTSVKFQVAGSSSRYGPFNFVGPDGTTNTFFATSGASLSQFNGMRYLEYKAFLATNNGSVTPTLSSVQVCFQDVGATSATNLAVAPATGTFGGTTNLSATLTAVGSPVSGETVSFSLNGSSVGSGTTNASGVATLSNVGLAGIDAGSYPTAVSASFLGDSTYDPSSGSSSLTVTKADQTITVTTHAPASAVFGASFGVAASGGGSGNAVTFSSSGACSNTGATFTITSGTGTCSVRYDQAGSANYNAAPQVVESTTAQKADQTITVTTHAPVSADYNTSFVVAATAPGGGVTFSSLGRCGNVGATFTITSGSGTCSVRYDQAGSANYNAAPQVVESTTAQKADQTITVTTHAPASAVYKTSFIVVATGGGSGNPVTFSSSGACSNTGSTFTMTSGTGTCSVKYDQAGDANYNSAPQVTETVTAQKASQSTSFAPLPDKTFGDADFTVSATASSGLAVSFTASGNCTVSGTTVHLTGSGSCTITAHQAGDADYDPAPDLPRTFAISGTMSITKTADASAVSAGSQIGFVVTLSNSGAGSVTGLSVADNLPAGAGVSWSVDAAGSSTGWSVTGTAPNQSLAYSPTSLAGGASTHVHVVSSTTGGSCGPYNNTASFSTANNGSGQASSSTTVNCATTSITKTADAASVSAGSQIGFVVTLANTGAGAANGLSVTDNLPGGAGVSWSVDAAGSSAGWSVTGTAPNQSLAYSPTSLAGGASTHVHVVSGTTTSSCGPYNNTASYTTGNDGSGQASASTTVTCASASQITTAAATCSQFAAGTAPGLSTVDYTPQGANIKKTSPGGFTYWVRLTAPAGADTFTVDEAITTGNFATKFALGGGSNVYTTGCSTRGLRARFSQAASATVTVTITAPAAGTYYVGVKYGTSAVTGKPAPNPTTVHYDFSTSGVPASTSGLDLKKMLTAAPTARTVWRSALFAALRR